MLEIDSHEIVRQAKIRKGGELRFSDLESRSSTHCLFGDDERPNNVPMKRFAGRFVVGCDLGRGDGLPQALLSRIQKELKA